MQLPGGEENGELFFNRYGSSVWENKIVLEVGGVALNASTTVLSQ